LGIKGEGASLAEAGYLRRGFGPDSFDDQLV
jgi:hypothetical protein